VYVCACVCRARTFTQRLHTESHARPICVSILRARPAIDCAPFATRWPLIVSLQRYPAYGPSSGQRAAHTKTPHLPKILPGLHSRRQPLQQPTLPQCQEFLIRCFGSRERCWCIWCPGQVRYSSQSVGVSHFALRSVADSPSSSRPCQRSPRLHSLFVGTKQRVFQPPECL
jgi:hypothetical protein